MEQRNLIKNQPPAKPIVVKPATPELAGTRAWQRRQEDGDELFDRVLHRMVQIDVRRRRRRMLLGLALVAIAAALAGGGFYLWKATLIKPHETKPAETLIE